MSKKIEVKEGYSTVKQESKKINNRNYLNDIINLGLFFVVCSIAYSTYMIVMGTEGIVPIIMVVPQAAFALSLIIIKFVK